jgi:hypothetical protein
VTWHCVAKLLSEPLQSVALTLRRPDTRLVACCLVCLSCHFGKKFAIWWERRARVQGPCGLARGQVLLGPTQVWHSSGESCCDSWHFRTTRVNESLAPGASSHPPTACASGSASVRSPVRVCSERTLSPTCRLVEGTDEFPSLGAKKLHLSCWVGGVASVLRRRTLN